MTLSRVPPGRSVRLAVGARPLPVARPVGTPDEIFENDAVSQSVEDGECRAIVLQTVTILVNQNITPRSWVFH